MTSRARLAALLILVVAWTAMMSAQTPRDARLTVTVVDQTNGVIPGATVTVVARDGTDGPAQPVQTSPQGTASIAALAPGRYDVRVEFPGFDPGLLKDVRLRAGDNRHVIVLNIQKMQDTVTVGQDPQAAASDRRGRSFGSALTREQIDALSDDPDEFRRQLEEIAGPGAVIRVDSFEGSPLPPK